MKESGKGLIIYFSRADENYAVGYIEKGNTEVVCEYIRDITKSDVFKVETENPYAKDYDTCIDEAKVRQKNHNAPIVKEIDSIENYEIIYIGSPVYWDYLPEEMVTALSKLDWNGKIIKPFITHEGSGFGLIPEQLKQICVGADIKDGLAIFGSAVNDSKSQVENWIKD